MPRKSGSGASVRTQVTRPIAYGYRRAAAAYCGITGLKPTYGRVPRHGVMGLAWSLDHAGPMARSVEDTALMLGVIAGGDARDPHAPDIEVPDYLAALEGGVEGVRVGLP